MRATAEIKRMAVDAVSRYDARTEVARRFYPSGGIVVEVGVLFGHYSKILLDILSPEELHLVDPWEKFAPSRTTTPDEAYKYVKSRFRSRKNVHVHRKPSLEAAAMFNDGGIDLAYIDANHSYHTCLADLEAWYPKVKSGGILAGDDWGVAQSGKNHGTVQAVLDFLKPGMFSEFYFIGDQFVGIKA